METVLARYDITNAILGLLGLVVVYPAFVFGVPLFRHDDYASFIDSTRYGYSWVVLMLASPYSVVVGGLLLVDMIRMKGGGVVVRDGLLIFSGPWRASVAIVAIEAVEVSRSPYGVRVRWAGRSRNFNTLLMRPGRAEILEAILALRPDLQPGETTTA